MLGDVTATADQTIQLLADTHFPGHVPSTAEIPLSKKKLNRRISHAQIMNNHKYMDVNYIQSIFAEFGPMKACGPDGIRPILLRHLPNAARLHVAALYKASLVLGYTPRSWRENKVIFLPKPGKSDYSQPKAYRPITLAPFLLKGLEKGLLWRLETTVLKRAVFSKHQHVFLPDRGCDSEGMDYIEKATLSGNKALCVSVDIRRAFDNVSIDAALAAMRKKRIPFWATRWLEFYLRNRFSTISLNGSSSTFRHTRGTPQGGVCSPIIWIIIFDSLLDDINIGTGAKAIGYADDCLIIIFGSDMALMQSIAKDALRKAEAWGLRSGLTFCPEKTMAIVFSRGTNLLPPPVLTLCGKPIPVTTRLNILA